jgi:hypothetical protein
VTRGPTGIPRTFEGVEPMGRGRAKAKQVKVARQLKYSGGGMDLDQLRAEFGVATDQRDQHDADDHAAYADFADRYSVDDESDEDDEDDLDEDDDFDEDDFDDDEDDLDEDDDFDEDDFDDDEDDDPADARQRRGGAAASMSRATGG